MARPDQQGSVLAQASWGKGIRVLRVMYTHYWLAWFSSGDADVVLHLGNLLKNVNSVVIKLLWDQSSSSVPWALSQAFSCLLWAPEVLTAKGSLVHTGAKGV